MSNLEFSLRTRFRSFGSVWQIVGTLVGRCSWRYGSAIELACRRDEMARAVIFDVDGTLIDSVDAHAQAWHDAFRDYGFDVDLASIRSQIGKGGDQLMPVFLPEPDLSAFGAEIEEHPRPDPQGAVSSCSPTISRGARAFRATSKRWSAGRCCIVRAGGGNSDLRINRWYRRPDGSRSFRAGRGKVEASARRIRIRIASVARCGAARCGGGGRLTVRCAGCRKGGSASGGRIVRGIRRTGFTGSGLHCNLSRYG